MKRARDRRHEQALLKLSTGPNLKKRDEFLLRRGSSFAGISNLRANPIYILVKWSVEDGTDGTVDWIEMDQFAEVPDGPLRVIYYDDNILVSDPTHLALYLAQLEHTNQIVWSDDADLLRTLLLNAENQEYSDAEGLDFGL